MLQSTEYQAGAYLKWLWRTGDFSRVMHRRQIVFTKKARLLQLLLVCLILVQAILSVIWLVYSIENHKQLGFGLALASLLLAPLIWAHLIILPLALGDLILTKPLIKSRVKKTEAIFANHRAVKIAVAGSYGKTTMKEILSTVLSEGKKVAVTPANKNVALSHAQFALSLTGDEEVLVIEYGEGAPGDVPGFVRHTHPNIGVITGLAPAHLDKYKSLEQAGQDIFVLAENLPPEDVYINRESSELAGFLKPDYMTYDRHHAADWKISNVKVTLGGVSFKMKKTSGVLDIKSSLLGLHQVGPLALAAVLANRLGLSKAQIERGTSKVQPFEHRMQPYRLGGATVIDDTYNGNIEGMVAGLELLKSLPAKRKIYVTPGLVDQGRESAQIHKRLGIAIADAGPDIAVLMQHSVTGSILAGIREGNFKGQVVIEEDPLNFYTNLDQFVAAGDLVLMQNDWPDNYN